MLAAAGDGEDERLHEQMPRGCCRALRWCKGASGAWGSFAVQGQGAFGRCSEKWSWPGYHLEMFLITALLGHAGILVRVGATCQRG